MHPSVRRVEDEKAFIMVDGAKLHSLDDLGLLLEAVEEAQFLHHVTTERNDFATWVRDAIGDAELADILLALHTAPAMAKAVKARLRTLRTEPGKPHPLFGGIREFIFGLLVGYVLGLIVSKIIF